jgi:protein-L-isoaspartate O-methyltransferase
VVPGGGGYSRAVCVKVRMTMCGVERERSLVAEAPRSSQLYLPDFPKLKVAFT